MNDVLGLDHICASSTNLKEISENDDLLGYKILFMKNNIPINYEKNDILFGNITSHDTVFLTNSKSVSIELINHDQKIINDKGQYDVLYELNRLPNINYLLEYDKTTNFLSKIFNEQIYRVLDKKSGLSFFVKNSKLNIGLTTIILKTINLERSIEFWVKNFNFEVTLRITPSCILLKLDSPISSWNVKLLLIENKNAIIKKSYLNYTGWTCLSFIVKRIDSFLSKIDYFDFSFIGKPYEFNIGGKNLKLVFLRGPEQQLIELVEIKQNHD